jgi:4-amino-4-deoxy-L-arabinose transferase-like glycosyltransferase
MPYMKYYGDMINQPPLGFYIEALFFKVFGLSFGNGVALIMLFGLGCTVLVYKIGEVLYGKTTGLLAAVLFASTPWELVLSRSFLIDVQCLFFSLFCLLVGIYAIRKDSEGLFMVSGTLFALALLTKFFAIFTLIPLALFYFRYRQKNLRRIFAVAAYFLPVLLLSFLWYDAIWGRGLLYLDSHAAFSHDDFVSVNASGVVPSYFFVGTFLLYYGLGWFFVGAVVLSLLVCLLFRKVFSRFLVFDLICLATIVCVVGVNIFLGAGLNLSFPYNNAIKYDYQSLPFFSLLAASLASKCFSLFRSAGSKRKLSKLLFFSVALVGLFLLVASIFANLYSAHLFSLWPDLLFRVEMGKDAGYLFINSKPIERIGFELDVQHLGFAFLIAGLLWAGRHKLEGLLKLVVAKLKPRNAVSLAK